MLGWKSQGNNYALRQWDDNGVPNERPPLILAGESEWVIIPQKPNIFLALILDPLAGCTATVDFCYDLMTDINTQMAVGFSGTNTLIWRPSALGNVTAATENDGKELFFAGNPTAFRVNAVGGNCRVRGTL